MQTEQTMTKLSSLEQELLRRWQKDKTISVPQSVKDELKLKFDGEILLNEPMSRHTYIKIGGPADVFLKPRTIEATIFALKLAHDNHIPVHFHGLGANTLVRDKGLRGFVICLYDSLKEFAVTAETEDYFDVEAEAGTPFSRLTHFAKDIAATGLTPLTGIPGSVGGLVSMNAGTREREIKDILRSITILTREFEIKTLSREELDFEYRKLKLARTNLILKAVFRLEKSKSKEELEEETRLYQKRRVDTQPLNYPNLGSIFKNPAHTVGGPKVTAGQLIDEAGLKDIRVGGARISPKHANFIINEGNALAKDVLALIDLAKDRVKILTGIELETEIKVIGEDEER